eukprot:965434-Rhodomonas_salina.4
MERGLSMRLISRRGAQHTVGGATKLYPPSWNLVGHSESQYESLYQYTTSRAPEIQYKKPPFQYSLYHRCGFFCLSLQCVSVLCRAVARVALVRTSAAQHRIRRAQDNHARNAGMKATLQTQGQETASWTRVHRGGSKFGISFSDSSFAGG